MTDICWVTHPRHLPKPPGGRVVVVDVAFASGKQFEKKTKKLIDGLDDRLLMWIDHHEHKTAWEQYKHDPRFLLVSNRIAHACPELITTELVQKTESHHGHVDTIMAHCDFDGAIAAVKWMMGGEEPWPGADEDARFVDSPGRGHTISKTGLRIARAMGQAAQSYSRSMRIDFMTRAAMAIVRQEESLELGDEIDTLSRRSEEEENRAKAYALEYGKEEGRGIYVIRALEPLDNHMRRNLLIEAEERATLGVIHEPDKEGGAWLTVATFSEKIDLSEVEFLDGGRTDYRYARAHKGGHKQIEELDAFLQKHDTHME